MIYTMDGCGPCNTIKQQFQNRPGLFQVHNRDPLFSRFRNNVQVFPTLGVLKGKKVYFYKGTTRIREYFLLNPR